MKRAELALEVKASSVPIRAMPPHCELFARAYVGDFAYGVLVDWKHRMFYLASVDGYYEVDVLQLLATFADAQREFDRDERWVDLRPLSGMVRPETILFQEPNGNRRPAGRARSPQFRVPKPKRRKPAARRTPDAAEGVRSRRANGAG